MADKTRILVIDDEPHIRVSLKKICEDEGFDVTAVSSAGKALKCIEDEPPEIIIIDIYLPDANGIEMLKTIKDVRPETIAITITGQADMRSAIEAMKAGAIDYLEKPIDFDKLRDLLNKARNKTKRKAPAKISTIDTSDFIFASDKMKEVVRIIENFATRSDVTILLLGESGTGKNFISKKMHDWSPRKDKPFVEIGCTSIPVHLIESELFGYEKGAFTDAKTSKQGLIEMAKGGTIFLDEIGDMPYTMQSKMLTLIEEKRFRKIGGLNYIKADVRIFAATNRNLYDLVQAKKFRLDLYYRLNVAAIEIPPLRERKEDIPVLINFYLNHFAQKYGTGPKTISEEALNLMRDYSWPGNVRELKNMIEKLHILSMSEMIDVNDLPQKFLHPMDGETLLEPLANMQSAINEAAKMSLNTVEIDYIKKALQLTEGNQKKAAEMLGISRDTLRYRLKKWGIKTAD
jgi:DNA-binding NtrC family response regulator